MSLGVDTTRMTKPNAPRRGPRKPVIFASRRQDHPDTAGAEPLLRGANTAPEPALAHPQPEPAEHTPKAKVDQGSEASKSAPSPNHIGAEGHSGPNPGAHPFARPAAMKRRHWGILFSFILMVLMPIAAVVLYLYVVAEDQYHSISGFTVRSQEESSANQLLSGLASFAGGSVATDSDILYEFIQSQEMVEAVDKRIALRPHYAQHRPGDWFYALKPDASREDLIAYWNRMVGISYDSGTGLIEVEVRAFDPETAREINRAIVSESQNRINALNQQAREDAMRYARADLEEALELLRSAREDLTSFRTRSQIVDPERDIQTRMGVMTNLQQQLAEALVEYDILRGGTLGNDPRVRDLERRIDVIRERIQIERQNFASSSRETGGLGQDYPSLIAEFERLTVDREYAEELYFASLTALEVARDEAVRQSRYLATYITPTLAEEAAYPKRAVLAGLVALFLLLAWSIAVLIYYSIRDRS
jgi:capsular polysaccharide transport system permease protein